MTTDGGQAFPGRQEVREGDYRDEWPEPGMTLRQWYAGMATDSDVETTMEDVNYVRYVKHGNDDKGIPLYQICTRVEARYAFADAMLAHDAETMKGDGDG